MIINEEPDQYVFYQENRFRILSGMARKCKEEENTSGDNFLLKKLNCGKMVAAIADGCGSGKRAFAESRMVIELMENCIEAGFEEKTAIDLINSAYIAGTTFNNPVTMDMSIIVYPCVKEGLIDPNTIIIPSMKLMVLDGNSILNRAYYGIRPLSTREGLYTHAVYGFITTLQRLLDEENPEALCVTFDRREPTFRHRADADYKAQRKPMPPELAMQLPVMKQVLSAMSVPCYELVGYEADDLIGTISRKCQAAGWDCVIVTGDKDSLQLITDHTKVKLVSTRMGQTTTKDMTETAFQEQYGFAPIHMIDLKALMGDSSDNIPGVPGIGEKTAMALIQQYESIDNLYAKMPDIDT